MSTAEKVNEIRNHLLPLTLENAVSESKFYKKTLGNLFKKVNAINDLPLLPILHKEEMAKNLAE